MKWDNIWTIDVIKIRIRTKISNKNNYKGNIMKGIVFTTLNDVVVNKYGLDTWEVLIKDVNHC
ncbi:hypothetical protein A6J39_014265 [Legionella anisa]|uniref:Transposase n=1 Tax=Legionella anisa TaxID=28082 RepID=A0AAX0WW53_9GAMM|nr:hypothetical protein DLD14_08140 [Legionella anisa]PNL62283.1 hypothetical protein A6J39_014265 [Legionella anisa]